jgi:hypothetical protein
VKTSTATTTTGSFTDITGLSQAITPASTSNKVLVTVQLNATHSATLTGGHIKIVRDSTDIYVGDAAGSRTRTSIFVYSGADIQNFSSSIVFLDSPSSASQITYKVQWMALGGYSIYLNRPVTDHDISGYPRSASSITLMEIKG